MVKLNKNTIQDKIHACWIGKNIGGTIGGPYEGRREILDIKGFTTKKGSPLPNDDLDLQLVWLKAMEELEKLEEDRRNGRLPGPVRKRGIASNEMCTFLILNISSLQLIPMNIIAYD